MVTCTNVLSLYNDVLLLYCTHCCVLQVCNVLSISVNTCLLYISSTVLWRTFRESVYDTASMSISRVKKREIFHQRLKNVRQLLTPPGSLPVDNNTLFNVLCDIAEDGRCDSQLPGTVYICRC